MILEKCRHPFPVIIDLDELGLGRRETIMAAIEPIFENYLSKDSAKTLRESLNTRYEFYDFVEGIDDHIGDFVTFLISKPIEEY